MNSILSLLLAALGVAVVARTVEAGVGGGLGLLLGGVLVLLGAARFYVGRR